MTNKAWVVMQSADNVMFITVIAATAERYLEIEVARLTKASSVSC